MALNEIDEFSLQGYRVERAKSFVEILSKTSAKMLRLFDALVTVDDVKLGSKWPALRLIHC